ncbi:MAG: pyridoxine 5'-phosphate synthase [Gammaproteobacteria bacterium]|uniref:Pyridoxine 5'-phosphate synthase n=1 Tax=OM182 bacterium MED-G24 TaxID=1986255 RepID=A0A2A5WUM7_9GAMM|nr:pyridoxine 5'-phosphate synthase [Gammaproteobacteria bacterium]PDH40131.1 MAG: pyridoxine 5'-phosphate synthase [OM182 bacterium MED-G24]RPG26110.1 MAG: pyridoxine 5'-phosphate synthase [Gammaproteobacteria bacterium TMED50]
MRRTKLSVNLNKVALLRNSRETTIPSVVDAARTVIAAGADGITVHPRPDMRHICPSDVYDLAELLAKPEYQHIEFNIEGNPYAEQEGDFPGFMTLIEDTRPHQCTLVPDTPDQLTSDHGWDLTTESNRLRPIVDQCRAANARVSLFMDPDVEQITRAAYLHADRIEFYTGPYAEAWASSAKDAEQHLSKFRDASHHAETEGLGINAGHDLNQQNLAAFCRTLGNVAEVSIGHAIVSDALWDGLTPTIVAYCRILDGVSDKA